MGNQHYWVYLLTNDKRTLYIGVTNDIVRRVWQHKQKESDGFTKRYDVTQLAYYEEFGDIKEAIAREKQLKAGSRSRKIHLIESINPHWEDLAADWY